MKSWSKPPEVQFLDDFSLIIFEPQARPTLASPRQGSTRVPATSQVGPAPSPAGPPGRSSPWSPASGDGRGPRRPPPRQLPLARRECAPPATPAPDLPAGDCGSPGQRPRAGQGTPRRPEALPGSLSVPGSTGRGEKPGGCRGPARPVARVAGTSHSPQHQAVAAADAAILPSTRCRRRRTPPQVSRMWAFPGVACAGAEDWGLLPAPPPAESAARGLLPAARPGCPVRRQRRPRLALPRTLLSPTHTRKPCHHAGSTRAVQMREAAQHIFKYTDENLLGRMLWKA
ncbi:collagen alpha-1(I) chain-like [Phyllostomus discolor]|uniref:Collagen alpha-1(I) chain-like n=1 Tax=Phyllostomus discolor TaxID=89673 RepID=A0A7E6DHQ7_9CHIR|nr:collagen alpha-1(I) chain-like [Phyllostomus discolor]